MKHVDAPNHHVQALSEAFCVAHGAQRPALSEGVSKLLGFMLKEGECDAWIREPQIDVRFSWLPNRRPCPYFVELAPGMLAELMTLGHISVIEQEAVFSIGPAECGVVPYRFQFARQWVQVRLEEHEIVIRVRAERARLMNPLKVPATP